MPSLPILDLTRLDHGPDQRRAFLAELRTVAREVGFFYLSGHGLEPAWSDQLGTLARRFFALPEADKAALAMVHSPQFRGYTRVGGELTRGRPDGREQLDFGAELPAVSPADARADPWWRLQGPNPWPAALPELRPAVLAWQERARGVLLRLLGAFALALEQPEDAFAPLVLGPPQHLLKLIRYPGREVTGDDQGVGAHKDSGLLTLLLQADRGGLEVETAAGWLAAPPVPGTFIINIGELLELASDGYLRATVHRVVSPPAGHDRLSLAFFLGAALDATVTPLPLPPALAADARGPERDPLNPLFHHVGRNALKGRLRSHPDVAQRHHADLLEPASP